MYESFYGFKEKPFSTLPDPAFLYMSKKHEMALTYMEYGLSSQAGFMVLTGEIGSGKTTLINYLIKSIDDPSTRIAFIFNTNISSSNFLKNILKEWDIDCGLTEESELYNALNDFLISQYTNNKKVILIIDEAQNLSFELLEEIRMISNLNDEKVPLLQIILSGQPSLINMLNNPKLEQLRQRVSVHYHLDSLNRDETTMYIKHRLKSADSKDPNVFISETIESIYKHSAGIPRIINLICDIALVHGYAEETKTITPTIIDTVVMERKKRGLGFLGRSILSNSPGTGQKNNETIKRIIFLETRYEELNNNVYKLALLVKKLISKKTATEV